MDPVEALASVGLADRVIHMHDGRVTEVELNKRPMNIEELVW